ncbi:hypothetical protein PV05_00602 [Exophiala xenobiotica]|uniref:Uncharacterized protein n=1 Tax=Exophiala xenobiotica TaxID=348802 RepID=A0A0D2F0B6_9EURO|nr:uncharacterized protein PV05_00602 [Exophiala xenobiotica]KIW60385.1 hypothetical protein PV05_00602 [Exophiala xenobiotica]
MFRCPAYDNCVGLALFQQLNRGHLPETLGSPVIFGGTIADTRGLLERASMRPAGGDGEMLEFTSKLQSPDFNAIDPSIHARTNMLGCCGVSARLDSIQGGGDSTFSSQISAAARP